MSVPIPDNPFRLDGQVALVTGGGSGLGLAIATAIAGAGARVVITGRRKDVLDRAVEQIGSGALALPADITQRERINALIDDVETQAGPLDILVNNAGLHLKQPALCTSDEDFDLVMRTHVNAGFALARDAGRRMTARKCGSIVFIGSMAAMFGIPDVSAYTAAKSAVTGLVRSLAVEWSGQGVRVNIVTPGWIDTGMARKALAQDPRRKARILSRTPMERLGSDTDIAHAVLYLCSPAARFVTGTNLVVDGGASIGF